MSNPLSSVWEDMTTQQKLIAGGAVAAIGFGVVVAIKNGKENASSTEVFRPIDTSEDEQLQPWEDDPVGGGSPVVVTPVTPIVPELPTVTPVSPYIPAVPYDKNIYGNGGANYNELSTADKKAMTDSYNKLFTDDGYLDYEQQRTAQVIANREAAGLDTTEQLAYQQKLEGIASGTTQAPTAGKTPTTSSSSQTSTSSTKSTSQTVTVPTSSKTSTTVVAGGANYNTATAAQKASMENIGKQLSSGNQTFISSELARAEQVKAANKAAGKSTADQDAYIAKLNAAKK
jgi:hypothetical protein